MPQRSLLLTALFCAGALSNVQAATAGLPFKIIDYDASYTLHSTWSTAPGVPLSAGSRIHLHYGFNTAALRNLTVRLNSATVKYPAFMPYGQAQWSRDVSLPKGFAWQAKDREQQVKNTAGLFTEQVKLLNPEELRVTYRMQLAHLVYSPEEYPDLYKLVSQAYAITQEGFAVGK